MIILTGKYKRTPYIQTIQIQTRDFFFFLIEILEFSLQHSRLRIQDCHSNRSQLWLGLDPWPGNSHLMGYSQKKKKKAKTHLALDAAPNVLIFY